MTNEQPNYIGKDDWKSFIPCQWCGKTYTQHDDPRPPGSPTPKVPCLMLKSGFIKRENSSNKTMTNEQRLREDLLDKLLKGLNENVFIKSINSITDKEEELNPIIEDMEAIIKISGEWDREDLKEILHSLFAAHTTEVVEKIRGMKKTESSKGWEADARLFYSYGDKQAYNSALSDILTLLQEQG